MPGLSGGVIDATDVDATDVDDVDATQSVQSTIDDFEMVLGYCPEIKMPDSNGILCAIKGNSEWNPPPLRL